MAEHSHEGEIPLDDNGNCATCHQPVKKRSAEPSGRKTRSRVTITEPEGEEGLLEDLMFQLGERWCVVWPTLEPGTPNWKYRVAHYAFTELLSTGHMPEEEGGDE